MELNILPFFGMEKEKEVVKLLKKHIEIIKKTNVAFNEMVEHFMKGDKKFWECVSNIKKLEREADIVEDKIKRLLFSGAFLPMMRGHILNLTGHIDDVEDSFKDSSHVFSNLFGKDIPRFVKKSLKEMVENNNEGINLLEVSMKNFIEGKKEIEEKLKGVKEVEEKADEIQGKIFDYVLDDKNRVGAKKAWMMGSLAHFISEIADNIKYSVKLMSLIMAIKEA